MNLGMPTAIINGIDEFGAKVLAEELAKKDINVIGIGGVGWWSEEVAGVEFRTNLEEVDVPVAYMFDFVGEKKFWERAKIEGAKLAIVGFNREPVGGVDESEDCRKVWVRGVYGEGMGEDDDAGWLAKTLRLAVSNKNLVLPNKENDLRLMAVEDAVEVVLRATLLSGTSGEEYEVWGEKYSHEEIVKILIDEAKMTRHKVIEDNSMEMVLPERVEDTWDRLRWKPVIELKNGIKKVMQYFFTLIDEESRRKVKTTKNSKIETLKPKKEEVVEKKTENNRRMEVVVEEEEILENSKIETLNTKTATLEVENEEAEVEEEPEWQVKPLLNKKYYEGIEVKNSNNRPVAVEEEEEETRNEKLETRIVPEIVMQEEETRNEKLETGIKNKKRWKIKWRWVGMGGGVAVVLGLVYFWGSMLVWWNWTKGVEAKLAENKYGEAGKDIVKIANNIEKRVSFMENSGLVKSRSGWRLVEGLKVWREGMEVLAAGVDLAEEGQTLNEAVFGEKEIDWEKEIVKMKENLKITVEKSGLVEARLGGDWSWLPSGIRQRVNELKRQIREVRSLASMGESLLSIVPEMVGAEGKRKEYIVLFQNENELRPGGGFIGSYAILSFEGGKMLDLDVKDVYEADGQLKGHVDPPEPIKIYLNEAGYKMRDSNWEASFPATAKNIKWFLEKSTGRAVDGVVGVNLAVAKAMLEATGEVVVPDFTEKVSKDNLYEQAEFYSEKNFFPGSTQKQTFLGNLGKQLFEEIKTLKPEKQWALVKNMLNKLEENEIQISVNEAKTEQVLTSLGWNGAIYSGKCPSTTPTASQSGGQGCFADYLSIVEANLGVNKANYFVYRNVDETVEIGANTVSRVLKINYENTAKNTNWPGGNYKNYLRVYIPETANLAEVSVSDPKGGKTIYSGEALTIKSVYGKKEIGVLVEVPILSKRVVEVRYVDGINLNKGDKFSYLQYIQKQSGFGETGWVTLVSFPEDWQINVVEPEASVVGGKLLFNQKLTKDIRMGVEITK